MMNKQPADSYHCSRGHSGINFIPVLFMTARQEANQDLASLNTTSGMQGW